MKNYDHFNKHLVQMREFLELEKQFSNEFITRVYEVQLNSILDWTKGIPKLSQYLQDFNNPKQYKNKKLKRLFNQKISQNKTQLLTVEKSISEQFPIFCIQGPPGTGKTSVIVEIIRQELAKNPKKKILITSQSNLAVDNVLERLIDLKKIKILRIGNHEKVSEIVRPYLLENLKSKLYRRNSIQLMFWNILKFLLLLPVLLLSKNPKTYAKKKNNNLYEIVSKQINVIGATCIGSADNLIEYLDNKISLVIVDEAGRSTPMETLVPLRYADRAILVGDHKQLPPVIKSEVKNAWVKTGQQIEDCPGYYSFFEYLLYQLPKEAFTTLDIQFRMHPQIGDFVGKVFYNSEGLKTGIKAETASIEGFPEAISYHSTNNSGEEQYEKFHDDLKSYYNTAEAKMILKIIEIVKNQQPNLGVSIISFYAGQVELIKQLLAKKNINNIEVATLDSYQGREQDIVILSLVRCSTKINSFDANWYKFFLDIKRLNVALSRAKKRLMIVGNLEQLMEVKKNREQIHGFDVAEKLLDYINSNNLKVDLLS
jgi:superfamily I DNA and/or RNA helicase